MYNILKDKLCIFDMDGTLLPRSSGLLETAKVVGSVSSLEYLEGEYAAGKLDTISFTLKIAEMWGPVAPHLSRRAFDQAVKLDQIAECNAIIKASGGKSCIITMSQDFFANYFYGFGFDYIFSSKYPAHHVSNVHILTPNDKISISKALCAELSFKFEESYAFGDSLSDLPLFGFLKNSVSVNGDSAAETAARSVYRGSSILEALQLALENSES